MSPTTCSTFAVATRRTWLLDGIPVINTAIAQNVGPQFDPKDLEYVEVNRGSYGAEFGDRTYGVFNVVPRTGFERNNEAEARPQRRQFLPDQRRHQFWQPHRTLRLLRQRQRQPQRPRLAAARSSGRARRRQRRRRLRVVHLQRRSLQPASPRDLAPPRLFPDPLRSLPQRHRKQSCERLSTQYPSIGLRDGEHEADAGILFTWLHTFNSHLMTTVSPFYHYNSGDYDSQPNDIPIATTENRGSTYVGGQASLAANYKKNDLQVGFLSFYQSDNQLFGAIFNDGSGNPPITDTEHPTANLEAFYIDDKFKPFSWLTLSAGMRPTRFSEGNFAVTATAPPVDESAISPRFGATVTIPRLHWTFRAFYGHYYQAPPIETVSGPALISYTGQQGLGFATLHGERDEEHQFGVTIPYRGWVLDADNFQTNVANFLDHNNIGASSIFFPLTVSQAVIRGWELTLRSPRFAHRGQVHLAYSNQIAEGAGTITGGLTDFSFSPGLSSARPRPAQHAQRWR